MWLELGLAALAAVVVALVVRTFLVQAFYIPSGSMQNTVAIGERVIVDKVTYRFREPRRGEIVVFSGVDSFTPEGPTKAASGPTVRLRAVLADLGVAPSVDPDFIKRVIGLPGDRVACCDSSGRVTVNGTPLQEAGYLYPGDAPSALRFSVLVPPGKLWVMGDHRAVSQDSRAHLGDPGGGFVPIDRVVGRAFATVWPPQRGRLLGTPATFASVHAAWACGVPGVAPTAAVVAGNPGLAATACSRWPLGASRSPLPGPQQRGRTVRG